MIVSSPRGYERPVKNAEPVWVIGWHLRWCPTCEDWTAHADDVSTCTRCGLVREFGKRED